MGTTGRLELTRGAVVYLEKLFGVIFSIPDLPTRAPKQKYCLVTPLGGVCKYGQSSTSELVAMQVEKVLVGSMRRHQRISWLWWTGVALLYVVSSVCSPSCGACSRSNHGHVLYVFVAL